MNKMEKKIIDSAHRLFINKGFINTSIQDILDEAKVAKGTFYNYFTSKNECLMAILQYVYEETNLKRREVAHGKNINTEEVLATQIAIRMNTNQKHSIMALFSSVSLSDDKDLKEFLDNQHKEELKWVAKRLVDIYGPKVEKQAIDYAVILIGITHHFLHMLKVKEQEKIAPEKVIVSALKRMRPMIEAEFQEVLFPVDMLSTSTELDNENIADLKVRVVSELKSLLSKMKHSAKKTDYLHFLIDELEMDEPRLFLLESILMSLSKAVEGSSGENAVIEVQKLLWDLIEKMKDAS